MDLTDLSDQLDALVRAVDALQRRVMRARMFIRHRALPPGAVPNAPAPFQLVPGITWPGANGPHTITVGTTTFDLGSWPDCVGLPSAIAPLVVQDGVADYAVLSAAVDGLASITAWWDHAYQHMLERVVAAADRSRAMHQLRSAAALFVLGGRAATQPDPPPWLEDEPAITMMTVIAGELLQLWEVANDLDSAMAPIRSFAPITICVGWRWPCRWWTYIGAGKHPTRLDSSYLPEELGNRCRWEPSRVLQVVNRLQAARSRALQYLEEVRGWTEG